MSFLTRVDAEVDEDDFEKVEEHMDKNPEIRRDSKSAVAEYAFELASEKVEELDEEEEELGSKYHEHQKKLKELGEGI